jgi:hypothetical protein
MNRKMTRSLTAWLSAAVLVTALLACNGLRITFPTSAPAGPTEVPTVEVGQTELPTTAGEPASPTTESVPTVAENTPTATSTPIVHVLVPGEPPASFLSEMTDRDTSSLASQRRALGENFNQNLYERPFNANTMDKYFPDLDILRARLSRDSQWFFVEIKLAGQDPAGGLLGVYGAEIDLNVNGRGDVLLMAAKPGPAWSTDGVRAWRDGNNDVGAAHPIGSDGPVNGDGYETLLFDSGVGSDPDVAWARISPTDPNSVQIAFKRSLIGDDSNFTWGAWAMSESMLNPAWFDYNDHFSHAEAGSPLTESTEFYPLKAFAEVDNTCRWAVGFTPTGSEPGICPVPATPTPVVPAKIVGLVWYDYNQNTVFNSPPDYGYPSTSVRVRTGTCASPGGTVATISTNAWGNYTVTVSAGTYCVDVPTMPASANRGSGPVDVTVHAGDTGVANFRFWYLIF